MNFWKFCGQKEQGSSGDDHRSRGAQGYQKRGLELWNVSAQVPKTSGFVEPWEGCWRWQELGEVILSIRRGYCDNTAYLTTTGCCPFGLQSPPLLSGLRISTSRRSSENRKGKRRKSPQHNTLPWLPSKPIPSPGHPQLILISVVGVGRDSPYSSAALPCEHRPPFRPRS